MPQDPNSEKLATETAPAAPPAENQPQETAQPEVPTTEAPAATPAAIEDDSESLWERLRHAGKSFLRGWRGLPVEIPPGEEGTVPVVEAAAVQRKLEKKLAKSAATAEKFRSELDQKEREIGELNAAQRELQRELKRVRSAAEETEEQRRKDLEKARETLQARDSSIGKLESDVAQGKATIKERDSSIAQLKRDLDEAQRATREKGESARHETDLLRSQLDERSATRAKTQEALAEQQARGDRLAADLRQVREQFEQDKAEFLRVREEVEPQISRLRMDLVASGEKLTALRGEKEQAESASSLAIAGLRQEVDALKQSVAQRETEMETLRSQMSAQDTEYRGQLAEAARQQDALRTEVQRWQTRNAETDSVADRLREELRALKADRTTLEEVRRKAAQAERELAKKSEEAELLREDLISHRRRVLDLETSLQNAADLETERATFQRELQRQGVQLETLREQFSEAQVRLAKIEAALKDFHGPAVSAVQVAGVYAESVAGSLALSDSDRTDIIEIKQNMDQLRQILQKLAARMSELGISYS